MHDVGRSSRCQQNCRFWNQNTFPGYMFSFFPKPVLLHVWSEANGGGRGSCTEHDCHLRNKGTDGVDFLPVSFLLPFLLTFFLPVSYYKASALAYVSISAICGAGRAPRACHVFVGCVRAVTLTTVTWKLLNGMHKLVRPHLKYFHFHQPLVSYRPLCPSLSR